MHMEQIDLQSNTKFYNIPRFPNYMINKFGKIYDKNTENLIPGSKKVSLMNVYGNYATMDIERLMCDTFYGISNITFINDMPGYFDSSKIRLDIHLDEVIKMPNGDFSIQGEDFRRVYDSIYLISKRGVCYNLKDNRFIKANIKKGYYEFPTIGRACNISYRVHRIVYQIWNNCCLPNDVEIDHLNGFKWDNFLENLEPVDSLENIYRSTLLKYLTDGKTVKALIDQVSTLICDGIQYSEIAMITGIPESTIKQIATKQSYSKYTTKYDFFHSKGHITEKEAFDMIDLFNKNYKVGQVAKIVGLPEEKVRSFRDGHTMSKLHNLINPSLDGRCSLTEKEVIQIKKLIDNTSLSESFIGDLYGVNRKVINGIKHNQIKSYANILKANGLIS